MIAQTKSEFFYNVMVISLFIGSIQSASRVMMTKLLETKDLGKGFGFLVSLVVSLLLLDHC